MEKRTAAFLGFAIAVAFSPAALAGGHTTDFEATNGWTFQTNSATHNWAIDGAPSLFTSPTQTMNNADDASTLSVTGSPSATGFSPNITFIGVGDRYLRFRCYRSVDVDYDNPGGCPTSADNNALLPERILQWGNNLSGGGTAELTFRFFTSGSPPAAALPTVDVSCPNNAWHLHTIKLLTGGVLNVDGVNVGGLGTQVNNLRNLIAHQVGYRFSWTFHLGGGGCPDDDDASFWAIDDFSMLDSDTDPFAPTPTGGGGGGGGGGGSGTCSSAAAAPDAGSAGVLLLAVALIALRLLAR